MTKNHYDGKKLRGTHTTFVDAARKLVAYAERETFITGIGLGPIKHGGRSIRVTFKKGGGCLIATVVSNSVVQKITFYTTDLEGMEAALNAVF